MPKTCYECNKYPVCNQFQEIRKIIEKCAYCFNSKNVFIALSSCCKYYFSETKGDDE